MAEERRRRSQRRRDAGAQPEGQPPAPRHARYPDEPTGQEAYWPEAPLPFSEPEPPPPFDTASQSHQAPPPEEGWQDSAWSPPPQRAPAPWAQEVPGAVRDGQGRYLALFIVSLLLLCALAVFVALSYSPKADFERRRAILEGGTFFPGVHIDGIPLGGLRPEAARQLLDLRATQADQDLRYEVRVDGESYTLTAAQLPYKLNSNAQLATAWALGRQGFVWGIGSDRTPFDIRYEHTRQVAATKPQLATQRSFDLADARRAAEAISALHDREPIIAVVASFDFDSRRFSFTQDVPGKRLDSEKLYQQLAAALQRGDRQAVFSLQSEVLLPRVTSVELQNSFTQLATFSTKTTSDEKRNTNISLAARAIHGQTVMPGQSFSFNQATGERSVQKGYQMAPAIVGGQSQDEIGGGVCQVSTTLFNAAALSGMSIVTREPHAWPSNYVDKGLDATVNWPNLDFVFRNDGQTPVFIVAGYAGREVSVSLYGMRSDPTQSIRLETELTSQMEPPREPFYQQNLSLAPGTQRVLKQARTGYTVDTYRVWLQNGQPFRREKLFTSNYRMVQQVIEYN